MGVFKRISNLLKGYANSAIDSLEDPKIVVEQAIRDMEEVKKETTDAVAQCMAEEKRLKALYEEATKKVSVWHTRAANALKANNETDAKEALQERNNFKAQADNLKESLDDQTQQVTLLRQSLDEINSRLEDAKRRKDNIIAQDRINQANENVNKVLTKTAKNNVFESLDRMEEKVNSQKFKVESLRDLETESNLDNKFSKYDSTVLTDNDLEALKSEVFGSNVDSDLDSLRKEIEG